MAKKIATAILLCAVMVLIAAAPLATADPHHIVKGAQGPRASAVTWKYEPTSYGVWTGHIVNAGLRSLVIDVEDVTMGMPVSELHQRIRFAAYPTNVVDTQTVVMSAGRVYNITATPNGPRGTFCDVDDWFKPANPPVASFKIVSIDFLTVTVDASASYDPDLTPLTYEWNFGDSTTGTGVIATHTYAKDGTYVITLTVTDADNMSNQTSLTASVAHERIPPVALFAATMDWMTVSVDATGSYDPDAALWGPIASYAWDFGDLTTGSGVTATHTYATEGWYTIVLTVTDADGLTATASTLVHAVPLNPPVASFVVTAIDYLSVTVDGSASSDPMGTPLTYAWDFGDLGSGAGPIVTHVYAKDGMYTITLKVTNGLGMTDSTSQQVQVAHQRIPPVALFTAGMSWMTASVDASASYDPDAALWGPIASYAWDFGDLTTGSGKITTHTYALPGLYTITLTVTDADGLTATASTGVNAVQPAPPVAMLTVVGITYLKVDVSAAGSYDPDGTIASYAWTFGDGGIASGDLASHTYAMDGTYTITLTVTDMEGLSASASTVVQVSHERIPPVAQFTADMSWMTVSVNAAGSFDPDAALWGPIASYDWNFGDGALASGVTATHTYSVEGPYTITLTVTDADGLTGTATAIVNAIMPKPPVAVFTVDIVFLNVGVSSVGSYDPDGSIVSFEWTFGDGAIASGPTASHAYAMDGTYTITLTVTDKEGLTNTASKAVQVAHERIPPVAVMSASMDQMTASVSAAGSYDPDAALWGPIASYAWDFGDGASASGMTATHTYSVEGAYTITLTVTDADGLTGTASERVNAAVSKPPVAVITLVGTLYLKVDVSGAASYDPDGTIMSYDWAFGDGAIASGPTASHTYAKDGTYTITLTVTDNIGLIGTATLGVQVAHERIPPVAVMSASMSWMTASVNGAGSYDPDAALWGPIASYAWDFGDGASASGITATHTYSLEGAYTITLTVTDADGLTATATQLVNAVLPKPPVAVIAVSITYLNVAVNGAGSYDSDGIIVSYAWTFGDGAIASGPTASHTYAVDGTYTITLTVTDGEGLSNTASKAVQVAHERIPPVAVMSASMDWMTASVSAAGSYDPDAALWGPIASYAWNFGDGTLATGLTATHTYSVEGPYTITLTVTDADGLTATATQLVNAVLPKPPVAVFTVDIVFLNVGVNSVGSYDPDGIIVSYAWTFGDGAIASGPTASHAYAMDGTYTITLTVTDKEGLTNTASKAVQVAHERIPPVAMMTASMNWMTASVSDAGSYDPDAALWGPIASYAWDFGDGASASGMTATHTYSVEGAYTITLTVTDADGLTGTASALVNAVLPKPPVAVIAVSITYLNVAVNGAGSYDPDGIVVSYDWTFGDGAIASGPTASHAYAKDGTYTITLTVTDREGLTNTASKAVQVAHERIPPVAMMTASMSWMTASVSDAGSYDPDAALWGPIASYAWSFGDGAVASGLSATHTYSVEGSYTITLTVTDADGLTGTASALVNAVLPKPPVAVITVVGTLFLKVDVSGATSFDPDGVIVSYAWTFGDGAIASGPTASHTYAVDGTYTITLTVTDGEGLSNTASKAVQVAHERIPPVAMMTASMSWMTASVNGAGSYDPDAALWGPIASYAWNFGDGALASGVTATHTYSVEGTYTITLTVTDADGLTGTATSLVNAVLPKPPVAVIGSATIVNLDLSVSAAGSYDPDGIIVSYEWTFGDGGTATGSTATHTYVAGTYTVTLTVTDGEGLKGTASTQVTAKNPPVPPVASFTTSMSWMTVTVNAAASYDPDMALPLTYAWNFGDLSTGTGVTATHTYLAEGLYTVTLVVTDADGLSSLPATAQVQAIAMKPPVASFTISKTDLVVSVDGRASSDPDGTVVGWAWTFGDGGIATGSTATHTYLAGGTYPITLIVTDNNGLTSAPLTQSVTVVPDLPPTASFTYTVTGQTVNVVSTSTDDKGIVSWAWTWGDGSTGTGATASHTYTKPLAAPSPSSHLVAAGPIAMAPGPPFLVFGILSDSTGAPVAGADVTITDIRAGVVITTATYVSEFDGYYEINMGAINAVNGGDVMHVEAVFGALTGSGEAVVPPQVGPYVSIDITMSGGSVPVTVIYDVTLTVTDTKGQTASVTQKVSITFP